MKQSKQKQHVTNTYSPTCTSTILLFHLTVMKAEGCISTLLRGSLLSADEHALTLFERNAMRQNREGGRDKGGRGPLPEPPASSPVTFQNEARKKRKKEARKERRKKQK